MMMFILILHGMHGPMSVLIHSTLLSFSILSINNNRRTVMVLAHLSFAAYPLETNGPNPPPLSSVHIQHHRHHTPAYKLQQVDINLLQEIESSPSGSLWTD